MAYKEVNISISESQKDKIRRAINNKESVTIRINPVKGNDKLFLTETQITQLQKGKPINLTLS